MGGWHYSAVIVYVKMQNVLIYGYTTASHSLRVVSARRVNTFKGCFILSKRRNLLRNQDG